MTIVSAILQYNESTLLNLSMSGYCQLNGAALVLQTDFFSPRMPRKSSISGGAPKYKAFPTRSENKNQLWRSQGAARASFLLNPNSLTLNIVPSAQTA